MTPAAASPTSDMMALAQGRPADRDAALLRASAAVFSQEPMHDRDAVQRFEELAVHFLPRMSEADRSYIAGLLAARRDAPPELIRFLARDRIEVAEPVLRLSPVLNTIDLLGIIAATGREHHIAIAGRTTVSIDVARALRLAEEQAVEAERAQTPSRDVSPDAVPPQILNALETALDDTVEEIRTGGTDDDPLLPRDIRRLLGDGGASGFLALDADARLRLIRDVASALTAVGDVGPRLRATLSEAASTAEIAPAARRGDRSALVRGLSDRLDLAPSLIELLLADLSGEGMVLMLKATGMTTAEARVVLLLANPEIGQSVEAFFRLSDLLAAMEPRVAEGFVTSWQRPGARRIAEYGPPPPIETEPPIPDAEGMPETIGPDESFPT